jgi:hypothetical protein
MAPARANAIDQPAPDGGAGQDPRFASALSYGALVVAAAVEGAVVCGAEAEPDAVGLGVVETGLGESDGADVVGEAVAFLECVGVGDGVIVCAGVTITRGGGGGRTSR